MSAIVPKMSIAIAVSILLLMSGMLHCMPGFPHDSSEQYLLVSVWLPQLKNVMQLSRFGLKMKCYFGDYI